MRVPQRAAVSFRSSFAVSATAPPRVTDVLCVRACQKIKSPYAERGLCESASIIINCGHPAPGALKRVVSRLCRDPVARGVAHSPHA